MYNREPCIKYLDDIRNDNIISILNGIHNNEYNEQEKDNIFRSQLGSLINLVDNKIKEIFDNVILDSKTTEIINLKKNILRELKYDVRFIEILNSFGYKHEIDLYKFYMKDVL
jgi:hypothetical protein